MNKILGMKIESLNMKYHVLNEMMKDLDYSEEVYGNKATSEKAKFKDVKRQYLDLESICYF